MSGGSSYRGRVGLEHWTRGGTYRQVDGGVGGGVLSGFNCNRSEVKLVAKIKPIGGSV